MKKLKLLLFFITFIVAVGINSCKKDLAPVPNPQANMLTRISELPANQKVQPQEMMEWFNTYLQLSGLQPQWDKAMQNIVNGNHVIEVPTSTDAALFFTKMGGVLNIYAYKWLDQAPGTSSFSGKIMYYSFQDNKMYAAVYKKGKSIKAGAFNVPAPSPIPLVGNQQTTLSAGGAHGIHN